MIPALTLTFLPYRGGKKSRWKSPNFPNIEDCRKDVINLQLTYNFNPNGTKDLRQILNFFCDRSWKWIAVSEVITATNIITNMITIIIINNITIITTIITLHPYWPEERRLKADYDNNFESCLYLTNRQNRETKSVNLRCYLVIFIYFLFCSKHT